MLSFLQVCAVGEPAWRHSCCQLPIWWFCQASTPGFLQPVSGRCSVSLLGPGVLAETSRDEDRQAQLPRRLLRNLWRWHYQWGTVVWCARWADHGSLVLAEMSKMKIFPQCDDALKYAESWIIFQFFRWFVGTKLFHVPVFFKSLPCCCCFFLTFWDSTGRGQNFMVLKGFTATAVNEYSLLECLHRVEQVSVFGLSLSWKSRMFVRISWRLESLGTIYLIGSRCRLLGFAFHVAWRLLLS